MKSAHKPPVKTGRTKEPASRKNPAILTIDMLNVHFDLSGGKLLAVRDLSFILRKG